MKTIPFWKMSGSGNDFVVIDNRSKRVAGSLSRWAKRLCHRHEGVGADGLLLLEKSQKAAFRMVYFNSDGSRASMCGNGARCIAYFAHRSGLVNSEFSFDTDKGSVAARVSGEQVMITFTDAQGYRDSISASVKGKKYIMSFIDTGVPHAVYRVPHVETVPLSSLGRALRFHPVFGPQGANIDFIQRLGVHTLRVRTYERGVEGETLACGTGVVASAIVASLKGWVRTPVHCATAGGDTLEVDFQLHRDHPRQPATNVTLKAPVRLTFRGEIRI